MALQEEGNDVPSYVSNLLATERVSTDYEDNIKRTAASLYSGGADTVQSHIRVMLSYHLLTQSCRLYLRIILSSSL